MLLTSVRLLGDGLSICIGNTLPGSSVEVVGDIASLCKRLGQAQPQIVLVDVTQGVDRFQIQSIAQQWPEIFLVALGLNEVLQEVVRCGRAGFAGYISRESNVEELCQALKEISEGRLVCPPEIASGMLRALSREEAVPTSSRRRPEKALTRREREVLEQLGRGFSNKEIAKELSVSVATVKHHVHNLLEKLNVSKRAEAMRKVQEAPWLAATG